MNRNGEVKPTQGHARGVLPAIIVVLVLLLSGCKDFCFYSELGVKSGIRISPTSVTILTGNTMSFSAGGGHAPYVFKVISGNGSIVANTGIYTAPGSAGTDIVMVTDDNNLSATAQVRIVSTLDALQINPKVATLSPGGSITFVASGGIGPYTFGFQNNNSGGTVTTAGVYTAGAVSGVSDTIVVTDSDSPPVTCAVPATITVVSAATNVNYSVTAASFPGPALTGSAITGLFTITNSGSADGSKPVSWWLFLSDDGSFDGNGEILVASNGSGFLAAGDSGTVTPTGNWPASSGVFTLFVMISAEDDLTHGDNIYDAGTITLNAPVVDYRVVQVEYTGGGETVPGQPFTGRFQYANDGFLAEDNGLSTLSWEAYVSLQDAVLDPGDSRVAFGAGLSAMDAGAPPSVWIDFAGTWPLGCGDCYLIAKVSSPDNEMDAGNDQLASTGIQVGVYPEIEPNDEWQTLPGGPGGYNILTGASPPDPIRLQPGMSIRVQGTDIGNTDPDDVFMFNTGSANIITFTVTWNTGSSDIDLYIWRAPGGLPNDLIAVPGYAPDSLSASITRGALSQQFSADEDLWLDVRCNIAAPPPDSAVGTYNIIISAQ